MKTVLAILASKHTLPAGYDSWALRSPLNHGEYRLYKTLEALSLRGWKLYQGVDLVAYRSSDVPDDNEYAADCPANCWLFVHGYNLEDLLDAAAAALAEEPLHRFGAIRQVLHEWAVVRREAQDAVARAIALGAIS